MMSTRSHGRSRQEGCWRNTRGFTLVELLVVVSIIALLIAILLPSLKKAREQAKSVVCMGNLRGMGQAFTMYAESFGGVWPPGVDHQANENRWPVPFHRGGIIHAKYASFEDSSPFKQITPADDSVFICPAERAPRIISDWGGAIPGKPVDRVEVGGSYALNEELHRNPEGVLVRGDDETPPYMNKIDNCRRAAEVFAVMGHHRPLESTKSIGWRFNRGTKGNPADKTATLSVQGGAFWLGWRDRVTGEPLSNPNEYIEATRTIGAPHGAWGNGMCVDTHAERFQPLKVRYDQVSWTRWPRPDEKPFGGF